MSYKDFLPDRIKEARERMKPKMSQADLGKKVDVDAQMISYYETGAKTPPLDRLSKIADALGVSMSYLLGEDQTATLELNTVGDIMRSLDELQFAFQSSWKIDSEHGYYEGPDAEICPYRSARISIDLPIFLEKRIKDLNTMRDLRASKTIDDDIYQTWYSKLLQELDGMSIDGEWSK